MRHKDLESLKRRISECESHLEQDTPGDNTPDNNNLLDQGAEAEMATAPGADDTPSGSAVALASDSPPTEGHVAGLADLTVSSPRGPDGEG